MIIFRGTGKKKPVSSIQCGFLGFAVASHEGLHLRSSLGRVAPFGGSKLSVKLLRCFLSCTSLAVEVSFRVKGGAMDAFPIWSA